MEGAPSEILSNMASVGERYFFNNLPIFTIWIFNYFSVSYEYLGSIGDINISVDYISKFNFSSSACIRPRPAAMLTVD